MPSRSADIVGDRLERIFLGPYAFFWTAQMGSDHHPGALLQAVIDGGHGSGNARIGCNFAIFYGHIEIGANEYTLAFKIEIDDFNDGH